MYALVKDGDVESVTIGRLRRIPTDALDTFLQQRLRDNNSKGGYLMSRHRNGKSTIHKGADGYWHGRVTVGLRDDGKVAKPGRAVDRRGLAEILA